MEGGHSEMGDTQIPYIGDVKFNVLKEKKIAFLL